MKAYDRERHRRERVRHTAAVAALKGAPCMDCGGSFPHYVMDFDHREPDTKTMQVSDLVAKNKSWKRIVDEVAKCDLVCANCHRVRTFKRGQHRERIAATPNQLTLEIE